MWMAADATVPPQRTASRARGTSSPAGANRTARSSFSGGLSSAPPTHAAPMRRASSACLAPRVTTYTRQPIACATCSAMCAEEPKPYSPTVSPSCTSACFSAR